MALLRKDLKLSTQTPVGVASFAAVSSPIVDKEGRYPAAYVLTLEIDKDEKGADEFVKAIHDLQKTAAQELSDASAKSGKKVTYRLAHLPVEQNPETGGYRIKTRQKAEITTETGPVKMTVDVVDMNKMPVLETVGQGSTVRAIITAVPYEMRGEVGVTLRLVKVQVLNLKTPASSTPDFDSENEF